MADEGYRGTFDLNSDTSSRNSIDFIVRMILSGVATATVVRVEAVTNAGGVTPAGTVDVTPLVSLIDGRGDGVPHGVVYGLPYSRLQGGANAVIMDPQVGDLGIVVFASRDISKVKATKAAALPGSRRQFSMADGMYVGGILNGTPTQYVRFVPGGVEVVSPLKVTVTAPDIELAGDVVVTGDLTLPTGSVTVTAGDVTAGTIPLKTHRHTGVTTGGGTSAGPTP